MKGIFWRVLHLSSLPHSYYHYSPPLINGDGYNFPSAWEGYSLWQKYLMSKNCESTELAQKCVEEHAHLLNNLLSSFLELQSKFFAYRDHNPCQTCSRLCGDDSRVGRSSKPPPPPVSGRQGQVFLRRPKRPSPTSSSDSLPPLIPQSREHSSSPIHSTLFRVHFRSSVSILSFLWGVGNANVSFYRNLSLEPVLREDLPQEDPSHWDRLMPPYEPTSPSYHPQTPRLTPPLPLPSSSPNLWETPASPPIPQGRITSLRVPSQHCSCPQRTPLLPVENQENQAMPQRAHPYSRRQRVKMRIRSSLRDGLKDFSVDGIRMMALEAMSGLGLTPGGPCGACLNGGWCGTSSVCTALIKAHLS